MPPPSHPTFRDIGLITRTYEVFQKRDTPKINGSEGGFIALIVCLVLIIVVSCGAIYYLLRYYEPTDAQRAARRERRHRNLSPTHSRYSPSSFLSKLFKGQGDDEQKTSSLGDGSRLNLRRNGGGGHGWVQTGSGDEWDDYSGDETRRRELREVQGPIMYSAVRPPMTSFPSSDSASSVRFDLQPITTPARSLPNIHSRLSSPTSSDIPTPVRTASPEPISSTNNSYVPTSTPENKQGRSTSGSSSRTFSGGTKFIEAL